MRFKPNSDLKRFLKKAFGLLIILIILDFLIGGMLKFLFFKEKFNSVTYVINKTKADFLIFGSSRASHHYVPSVFEKKFHTSFYNCGRDSYKLIYHLAAISAVLERYSPKYIILELDPDDFETSEENRLSMLLPYKDNTAIKDFIKYNGKFERFKLLSKIYPYNSLIGDIMMGSLSSHKAGFGNDVEGYGKMTNTMVNHPIQLFKHDKITNERVEVLNDFLCRLNKKNIKITIVISPIYFRFLLPDQTVSIVAAFCKKYKNVHFINYENNPAFFDHQFFNDDFHMNDTGAHKFCEDLANKLTKI
jgi:hypothetical protein